MSYRTILSATGIAAVMIGIAVAASYRAIAIRWAPAKHAIVTRSAGAVAADAVFWRTFHSGHADRIQDAIEVLTRAYLATPNDPTTAAHLGWLHIWRIAERARLDSPPPSITEDMRLARQFFEEAVALDPSDARKAGFLASTLMGEAAITGDQRQMRRGYFAMLDAIKAWPTFNLFTAGYVVSALPAKSAQFREGLVWEWKDLEACARQSIDRTHPDFTNVMSRVVDRRACLNTWIAPHNGEGFFLNMGDMLVKAGDWEAAKIMYANAKLLPEYGSWPFANVLEDRIRNAQKNVARFNDPKTDPRVGIMNGTTFSCMGCHQQ